MLGRARNYLVIHRVALANQLRAHLRTFYPGPGCCMSSTAR
jgi:transposase